ncbi:hypothetical protein DITRI_Ditri05aG0145000 [Diplodiscus trichospermus]
MIKLNFDGAWQASTLTSGLGVFARDRDGEVLGACASRCQYIEDPTIWEEGQVGRLLLSKRIWGFSKIVVKRDALGVVNKVDRGERDMS